LIAVALVAVGCQPTPEPSSLRLLTDEVTRVSTDGHDGRIHVGVAATSEAHDVRLRVRGVNVARFARLVSADRRCRTSGPDVDCRLGTIRPEHAVRFTPVRVKPRTHVHPRDGLELPVLLMASRQKSLDHQTTLQIVRKATFVAQPERPIRDVPAGGSVSLRPTVLNVGPVAANDVRLQLYATDGAEFASAFRNCRPTTVGAGALCTFRQEVRPHAAVTVDRPLTFRLPQVIRGNITYLATSGPDPDSAPEYYGDPPASAPELRLVAADPSRLRSATGGVTWWGGFLDVRTRAKARIVARGATIPEKAGRTTMLVGVDNASARIVDASVLPKDPFLGTFTVRIPDGVEVVYVPYPGEEGWGDCSPAKPGRRTYVCRIPERLDQGQPVLQPFVVKVDPRRVSKPGRVTLQLRPDARSWDSSTADNSAAIVVQ